MKLCRALEALKSDCQPDSTERFVGLACLQVRRTLLDMARKYAGPHADANNFDSVAADSDGNHQTPDRAETTLNPERLARWTEFHERVDDLPDHLLDVFNLVYYTGLNNTQTAQVLNVSRQMVARRYRQALEHLARFLPVDDDSHDR